MSRPSTRQAWLMLGCILMTAFLLRALFAALPRVVRWDEAAYQLIAQNLLAGRGYFELLGARDLQQPPMVAYLSLLGFTLGLPIHWATSGVVHVLLGGLLVLPVYGLGHAIYGQRIGLIAGLLVAVFPALAVSPLYWSTMTEPPYLLFVMSGIYATWRASRSASGGWGWAAGMGLAFGLAYLTRPEALAYLAIMIAYLVFWRWWDAWSGRRASARPNNPSHRDPSETPEVDPASRVPSAFGRPLLLASTAIVVFLLCALPYVVYLHRVTGRWAFSGKQGISMAIAWAYVNHNQAEHDRVVAALDPTGREIMWLSPNQYDQSLAGWIAENPRRFIWQVKRNLDETRQALFNQDLFHPWMAALIVLGLFAHPWMRRRLRDESLLILALLPLVSLWAFFVLSRFLAIVVPIALLWMAAGVDHLAGWGDTTARNLLPRASNRERSPSALSRILVRALPLGITVLALLWTGCAVVRAELPKQPFFRLEAAQWLAGHASAGSPVMVRSSEVPLYAGLPQVAFPNAPWRQVLDYAVGHGARYLVVDDGEIRDIRPPLMALVEPGGAALPGVKLLARLPGRPRTTYIYEFEAIP